MPDLLAHVLLGYALARPLSTRSAWLDRPQVTVAMAGACIPDLAKAALVVPSSAVTAALGVPFEWFALHTLGGTLLVTLAGTLLVAGRWRRPVALLLGVGAGSHLLLDALLATPSGRSYAVLWPLTRLHPPTPGLYLSTDPWPTAAAALLALGAWALTR
jgi:hypothetical protein